MQHYGRPTTILSVAIHQSTDDGLNRSQLNEVDLRKYFQQFGHIIGCQWEENEHAKKAFLEFKDYDSVDQVMLYTGSHEINKIKVKVQKEMQAPRRRDRDGPNNHPRPYCVHITNLPPSITSEQLSLIFEVHVADILIRPQAIPEENEISEMLPWEASIKHSGNHQIVEKLVKKLGRRQLDSYTIQCECIQEEVHPSQLCEQFEIGQCKYQNDCNFKHWMCNEPDTCEDENCWFGHNERRTLKSNSRPRKERNSTYRIKLCNLPSNVTIEQLMSRLNIESKSMHNVKLSPEPCQNGTRTAYYANQVSENYTRKLVRKWHNQHFSDQSSRLIKCQVEYNVAIFDWNYQPAESVLMRDELQSSHIPSAVKLKSIVPEALAQDVQSIMNVENPSPISSAQHQTWADRVKPSPSKPKKHPTKSIFSNSSIDMPSDMAKYAPQWRWINEKTFENSHEKIEEYTVVSISDENRIATMRIFLSGDDNNNARFRACHELKILEKLQSITILYNVFVFGNIHGFYLGLKSVPKLITNNIHSSDKQSRNQDKFWIIIENVQGITLKDFLNEHRKLSISDAIVISRKLLLTIKHFHACNVIHRNLEPQNIIVKNFQRDENELTNMKKLQFVIINFNLAVINDSNIPFSKQDDFTLYGKQHCNEFEKIFHVTDPATTNHTFYRVPQLELRSMEELELSTTDEQQRIDELRSPTIDMSHICAILFWLITKRVPGAPKDINDQAPHELSDNIKLIETKLREITGVWNGKELFDHLKQHLNLIFDRGFAKFGLPWSFNELTFQFKFLRELIANERSMDSTAYWPKSIENSPLISFNMNDRFLRAATFIDHAKQYIASRYTNSTVRWATAEKSRWSGNSERLENYDEVTIEWPKNRKHVITTIWHVSISPNDDLGITVITKTHEKSEIELPLGTWEKGQANAMKQIAISLETKIKVLMKILCSNESHTS
ncbi:unnamed protein product [Rotaria sp. Silwood1]|nr:unnamed protein product [Rotaria sp. Silwood1]CAF1372886.1 unnamed protein product [Rotaria sp. Silwood1]CAF3569244.1 unnamed protein product [Rotaria sp. Silwood1]CAF4835844.1 unnamed protein product [Rotaria sp. Silwood1]